jgi:hypothetical protein
MESNSDDRSFQLFVSSISLRLMPAHCFEGRAWWCTPSAAIKSLFQLVERPHQSLRARKTLSIFSREIRGWPTPRDGSAPKIPVPGLLPAPEAVRSIDRDRARMFAMAWMPLKFPAVSRQLVLPVLQVFLFVFPQVSRGQPAPLRSALTTQIHLSFYAKKPFVIFLYKKFC